MSPGKKSAEFFLILSILFPCFTIAQRAKVLNLPGYENDWLHFGFSIMLNQDAPPQSGTSLPHTGFGLGTIAEFTINRYVCLRLLPDLSTYERSIRIANVIYRVESSFLNCPLNIKLRSARLNNFSAYLAGGGRISRQMPQGRTYAGPEAGSGVEFFMPFFKLGFELKLIGPLRELPFSNRNPAGALNSSQPQCLVLSLTFEG